MSEEEVKALVEMKDMLKAENTKLKQEKKELKNKLDIANKKLEFLDNQIKIVIDIIKQQPSADDEWILGRLNSFLSIIGGNDE